MIHIFIVWLLLVISSNACGGYALLPTAREKPEQSKSPRHETSYETGQRLERQHRQMSNWLHEGNRADGRYERRQEMSLTETAQAIAKRDHTDPILVEQSLVSGRVFEAQLPAIHAVAAQKWQHTNSKRHAAYQHAFANPQQLHQRYAIAPEIAAIKLPFGMKAQQLESFIGNALQQELHQEIIDGLQLSASRLDAITRPFSEQLFKTHAQESFCAAAATNHMGECVMTADLIDFGKAVLNFSIEFSKGFASGGIDSLGELAQLVAHPIDSSQKMLYAWGQLLQYSVETLYEYAPQTMGAEDLSLDEQIEYFRREHERVAQNWNNFTKTVAKTWNQTKPAEFAHALGTHVGNLLMSRASTGACAQLLSSVAKAAQLERRAAALVEAAEKITHTKRQPTPATTCIEHALATKYIHFRGKKLGYSTPEIQTTLLNLSHENVGGNAVEFAKQIKRLSDVPGAEDVIKKVFTHTQKVKEFGRAKGPLYELFVAKHLQEEGHTILGMSQKVNGHEIDIITDKLFVECKNVYWDFYAVDTKFHNNFRTQINKFTEESCQEKMKCILFTQHPIDKNSSVHKILDDAQCNYIHRSIYE